MLYFCIIRYQVGFYIYIFIFRHNGLYARLHISQEGDQPPHPVHPENTCDDARFTFLSAVSSSVPCSILHIFHHPPTHPFSKTLMIPLLSYIMFRFYYVSLYSSCAAFGDSWNHNINSNYDVKQHIECQTLFL